MRIQVNTTDLFTVPAELETLGRGQSAVAREKDYPHLGTRGLLAVILLLTESYIYGQLKKNALLVHVKLPR